MAARQKTELGILPECLYSQRLHEASDGPQNAAAQRAEMAELKFEVLRDVGLTEAQIDMEAHSLVMVEPEVLCGARNKADLQRISDWLMTLYQHNEAVGYFQPLEFSLLLNRYWRSVCEICLRRDIPQVRAVYHASPLNRLPTIQAAVSEGKLRAAPPQKLSVDTLRGRLRPVLRHIVQSAQKRWSSEAGK